MLGWMAKRNVPDYAAQGGRARAQKLSPEERSRIAREAAAVRWRTAGKDVRRTEFEGELTIGTTKMWCAVLDDGTRVLSRAEFIRAIGRKGKVKGGSKYERDFDNSKVPVFLGADNLSPFITKELIDNSKPVYFWTSGGPSWGVRAEVLPAVCQVYLDAKDAGVLRSNQLDIAEKCRILSRGFAVVGIYALIDEATGAQDVRARDALAKILQAFIAKELRKWIKTFPPEFYRELFRLRGLRLEQVRQMPSYVGHLTNDLVYARLAPGVLIELRRKNPVTETGRRRHKHHQWLTEDVGDPKLRMHLTKVTTLMQASENWDQFKSLVDRAMPRYSKEPLLAMIEEMEPTEPTRRAIQADQL